MTRGAGRSFIGLDLAWSVRNPSGGAVLDAGGCVVEVRHDLGDDREIVAWVRRHLEATTVIGIDMPTIVKNETGRRPCEGELAAAFRAQHAGPHPANRARFGGEGRARDLLDTLALDGVSEPLHVAPFQAGRFAFEVYPHPAHVRLFGLDRILKYKKKAGRSWPSVLAAWDEYRAHLAELASAEPPLSLGSVVPASASRVRYKASEDVLDAITCAYVASYLWRWGTTGDDGRRIYGDLETGYIAVPGRARYFCRERGMLSP